MILKTRIRQMEFYVTRSNNDISGLVNNLFQQSDRRLRIIHHIAYKFRKLANNK